jgi:hypothetical protein
VVNPDYFIRHEDVKRLNCQPSFFNPQKENVKKKENVEMSDPDTRPAPFHKTSSADTTNPSIGVLRKKMYCLPTASLRNFLTGVVKKLTNYSLQ